MDINDVRKELKKAQKDLFSKKGVVSVGVGYKTSKGQTTDQLSVICSVEQKKPKEAIAQKDMIPPTINGVATDVVQSGIIKAFSNTIRRRPALGGDSIGHYAITAGTFGCVVNKNGQTMILSNNHVMANSNEAQTGDAIIQPGSYDKGTLDDKIATLSEFVEIGFIESGLPTTDCPIAKSAAFAINVLAFLTGSKSRVQAYSLQAASNLIDAALAIPINELDISREILGIGAITGAKEAVLGMEVHKQGRTTGYTKGIIDQIDVTTQVSYGANKTAVFTDQVSISSPASTPFSQPGDSGSAVLSGTDLVGLLFAGSDTTTIVNRIQNVFTAFGCSV